MYFKESDLIGFNNGGKYLPENHSLITSIQTYEETLLWIGPIQKKTAYRFGWGGRFCASGTTMQWTDALVTSMGNSNGISGTAGRNTTDHKMNWSMKPCSIWNNGDIDVVWMEAYTTDNKPKHVADYYIQCSTRARLHAAVPTITHMSPTCECFWGEIPPHTFAKKQPLLMDAVRRKSTHWILVGNTE